MAAAFAPTSAHAIDPPTDTTKFALPHPATIRALVEPMLITSLEELSAWVRDGATVGSCQILSPGNFRCECIVLMKEDGSVLSIGKLEVSSSENSGPRIALEKARHVKPDSDEILSVWKLELPEAGREPLQISGLGYQPPRDRTKQVAVTGWIDFLEGGEVRLEGIAWHPRTELPKADERSCTYVSFHRQRVPPLASASHGNFQHEQWSITNFARPDILDQEKVRRRSLRADKPIDQSGWLPPRMRTSTKNIELSAPAYYFEPLTMGLAPAASLGNWYGAQLHMMRPSPGKNIWERDWLEVTLGYDPGEDDSPLVWSAIGRANVGDAKTHLSTSLENGEDLVWSAARLDRNAWSRSWRQDRVGVALHQDGLFFQLHGIQDQAIVDGEANTLQGGADLATRVPMSRRLHVDVLMRARSARPDLETSGVDTPSMDFKHDFQGAVSLGGKHGDRRKVWAEWMAGSLIESDVSRDGDARHSTSTGNALVAASSGVALEGRFANGWLHQINPEADLYATPFGFEKQPDAMDEQDASPLGWLVGAAHLKQHLKNNHRLFDLSVPLSLWGSYGRYEDLLWTASAEVSKSPKDWDEYSLPVPSLRARASVVGRLNASAEAETPGFDASLLWSDSVSAFGYWTSTLDPAARSLVSLGSFAQGLTPSTHVLVRDAFETSSNNTSDSPTWTHGAFATFGSPALGFEVGTSLYVSPTSAYGGSASLQLIPQSPWPGHAGWSIKGMAGYNKPSDTSRELMFLLGLSIPTEW